MVGAPTQGGLLQGLAIPAPLAKLSRQRQHRQESKGAVVVERHLTQMLAYGTPAGPPQKRGNDGPSSGRSRPALPGC